MKVSNWGKYPVVEAKVTEPAFSGDITSSLGNDPWIARGLGRSYGDASLQENIISTLKMNRLLDFNPETGVVSCESGTSLADLLDFFVPKGWFLPVTPGTKYITVGGAIAANVHGKNHHKEGSFCNHVESMELLLSDGTFLKCSPLENEDIFKATCGGMGLTGIITRASFRLKKIETSYITQTSFKAKDLEQIFRRFEETSDFTYTVAWIDCLAKGKNLGKSVLMVGEHTLKEELKAGKTPLQVSPKPRLNLPLNLPGFTLNAWTIKAFNQLYYARASDQKTMIIPYEPFFYPLDMILNWNRMYGKKGFLQYQFVLPLENSFDGIKEILKKISDKKEGSFLAVLKLFGEQDDMMSFPMKGYTLALDFPLNKNILKFLDELDEIVLKNNGRIYLAKDARMKKTLFDNGYPHHNEFAQIKSRLDPENKIRSMLSERLGL